jgi:hypothetical protein
LIPRECVPDETELAELVEFAKWVLENAGVLWLAAEFEKKTRLQTAFFPVG